MNKSIWSLMVVFLVALAGYGIWEITQDDGEIRASVSVAEAMGGGSNEGYLRATGPREFVFPDDHGPHPGFRTEWWYYTGNVFTDDGRQFGYQFTIFRSQMTPPDSNASDKAFSEDWNTNQLYLGHFAISDIENEDHVFEERYSRGAAGLAGSQAEPHRIWLEDWEIKRIENNDGNDKNFPVSIKAEMENGTALDLNITPAKPLVLQGEDGYDPKGSEQGNASYYLAFTRMKTEGTVTKDGEVHDVNGYSWMDHEWSTSALDEEQEGWDWFSIQLSNNYEIMYYQLRNSDGSVSQFTNGSIIDPEGNKSNFNPGDVSLEVLDRWVSPHSKAEYPTQWNLRIPNHGVDLQLSTVFPDQEMDVSVRYYEGVLKIEGEMYDERITGNGYIEMTGYGENEEDTIR
ncbi:lipocalin-like domain-containing protein [Gracilimonas sp. Q87]|uniref:lipocalin-like domain-containing protein n=1 Tax=Gracilimonas sp. Q87 TaxID=3384766 RepID=UPI0039844A46